MSLANPWRPRPTPPARGQIDEQEFPREIDRLRAFVESRAQAQESLLRAMLAESATRAAEALEGRIQLAAHEAMAYAADGLERQEATAASRAEAQESLLRAMLEESATRAAEALEGRIQLAACEAMAYAADGLERQEATAASRAEAQESLLRAMLAESATRAAEALEGRIQLAAREAIAYAADGLERQEATAASRAEAQEGLLRAMLAESATRAAEALEGRIQLAAREAIAYAASGFQRQEATLRALARRVAEVHRETPEPEAALAAPAVVGDYWIGAGAPEASDFRWLEIRDDAFLTDLANLPILPGGASTLVAANVVEFLPAAALCESVLPHWRSRLAPGGELVVITLDGPAWAADLAKGDFASLRRKLGADGTGRPPCNLLDAADLAEALRAAGLEPGEPGRAPPFALRIAARAAAT